MQSRSGNVLKRVEVLQRRARRRTREWRIARGAWRVSAVIEE